MTTKSDNDAEHVHVDGACLSNHDAAKARGGIGVYFGRDDQRNTAAPLPGAVQTNNRAELHAAITGIKLANRTRALHVYTDSSLVHNGITDWIVRWRKNGWCTANGAPVKNKDLWQELDELVTERLHPVYFHKVRGHSDDYGNSQADLLASKGARLLSVAAPAIK